MSEQIPIPTSSAEDNQSLHNLYSIISSIAAGETGPTDGLNEPVHAPEAEPLPVLPEVDLSDPEISRQLLEFWAEGITTMEIANRLGSSKKSVEQRIAKIRRGANDVEKQELADATETRNKLRGVDEHKWTPEMVDFLLDCKKKGMGNKEIGLLMNKTAKAVERKAYKLLRPQGPRTPGGRLIRPVLDEAEDHEREARLEDLRQQLAEVTDKQITLSNEQKRVMQLLAGQNPTAPDPVQQLHDLIKEQAGESTEAKPAAGLTEEEKAGLMNELSNIETEINHVRAQFEDLSGSLEAVQLEIKMRTDQLQAANGIPPRKRKRASDGGSARKRAKREASNEEVGDDTFGGAVDLALYDASAVPDVNAIISAAAEVGDDSLQVPVLGGSELSAPITPRASFRGTPSSLGRGRGKKPSRDDEDDFRPDMNEYAPPSVPTRQSSRRAVQTKSYASLVGSDSEDDDGDAVLDDDDEDDDDDMMDDDDDEERPRPRRGGFRGGRGGRGGFRGGRIGFNASTLAASASAAQAAAPVSAGPEVPESAAASMMNLLSTVASEAADKPPADAAAAAAAADVAAVEGEVAAAPALGEGAPVGDESGTPGPFKLI